MRDQSLDVLHYAGHSAPGRAVAPWAPVRSGDVRVGDVFSDIGSAAGDVLNALNPANVPGEIAQLLAHPGEIAKPLAYGSLLLTAGPAGLAEALALDKAGVLDGLAGVVDKLGGIYVAIWKGLSLNFLCQWVLSQLGLSQLGFACAIASITVDFVKAIVAGDKQAVIGILARVVDMAKSYGLDPLDYVTTVIQTGFQVAGDELAKIFGQLDVLLQALEEVIPLDEARYIVQTIRDAETEVTGAVLAASADAKGSLDQVDQVIASGKVDGHTATAGGLSADPARPGAQAPYLPFARYLRAAATGISDLAGTYGVTATTPTGSAYDWDSTANSVVLKPIGQVPALLTGVAPYLKAAALGVQSDANAADFAHVLTPGGRRLAGWVLRTQTPPAYSGAPYLRRWAALSRAAALGGRAPGASSGARLTFLEWLLKMLGLVGG